MTEIKSNKYIRFGPFLLFCTFMLATEVMAETILKNSYILNVVLEISLIAIIGIVFYIRNKESNFNHKISKELFEEYSAVEWDNAWHRFKRQEKWTGIALMMMLLSCLFMFSALVSAQETDVLIKSNKFYANLIGLFFCYGITFVFFSYSTSFKTKNETIKRWVEDYSYFKSQSVETTVKNHLSNRDLIKNTIFENVF